MDTYYKAYVKDILEMEEGPKCFLTVKASEYGEDILTNRTSSFESYSKIPRNKINEGDILCLYKPSGELVYNGVIRSIEEYQIQTDQIWSLFNGVWFYRTSKQDYLEHEVADIFSDYMQGKIGEVVTVLPEASEDSYKLNKLYLMLDGTVYKQYVVNKYENSGTYSYRIDNVGQLTEQELTSLVDPLQIKKFRAFDISYEGSQTIHLTSSDVNESSRNMEDFIYRLYSDYGIVLDIDIPYRGRCRINVKTPNYTGTKIGINTANIISITPKTETNENNKLIIMGSKGEYRKTYFATKNGIVEDGNDASRLPIINTTIVYSDDELADIKSQYLKNEMYNHEIVFNMILENKLYDFYNWKLGQPLEVFYEGDRYLSVFTGYSISFDENEIPSIVEITCGKVRSKLTDLINMSNR